MKRLFNISRYNKKIIRSYSSNNNFKINKDQEKAISLLIKSVNRIEFTGKDYIDYRYLVNLHSDYMAEKVKQILTKKRERLFELDPIRDKTEIIKLNRQIDRLTNLNPYDNCDILINFTM
jgi:hypothetical protein